MKVVDFIKSYKDKRIMNTRIDENAVEKYITTTLGVKSYLPFAAKRELCSTVLNACCTENGGIIEVDSVSRYILFTIKMLTTYTDLEFENDGDLDALDQYDLLCQNNLLNPILGCIGAEYETCNNMLNMMMADLDANNNNVAAVLNSAAQKLLDMVEDLKDVLAEKVESMQLDLSSLDKYKPLLEKFMKK